MHIICMEMILAQPADAIDPTAADSAGSAYRPATIFHRDFLGMQNFALLFAFDAIGYDRW